MLTIIRARGAAVPRGPHRLVYSYNPNSFRIGCAVSIAGLTALLVLCVCFALWPVDPVLAAAR